MTVDEINDLSALVAKHPRSDVLEALELMRRFETRREAERRARWESLGIDPFTETLSRAQHERILQAAVEDRAAELLAKMTKQLIGKKPKES